jgi:hypothetical protein
MDDEEVEEEVKKEEQNSKRRSLGIPELDPDALPSTVASKFLSLDPIKPSGFDNLVSVN